MNLKITKISFSRFHILIYSLAAVIAPSSLVAQPVVSDAPNNQKIGGICLRVDDDHSISLWYAYAKVFDKYGYHFTFSQNLELEDGVDDYFQMIRNLQASGHEMADHTPNHTTLFFTVDDTIPYSGLPGVDHIHSKTVFLKCDSTIDTSLDSWQTPPSGCIIDIKDGMAYSETPGAFHILANSNEDIWGIYIPGTRQIFNVWLPSNVWASDTSNIDTLKLLSLWGENIPIKDTSGVWCHFINYSNIRLTNDALRLLFQRTLQLCDAYGIKRPSTWIEPGGMWPYPNSLQLKQVFSTLGGYTQADSYPTVSSKCYDEYDPDQNKRFAITWGDFLEDRSDLQTLKSTIADGVAKHYFLVGHSHFNTLLGGWDGYLARMDSLLAWCQANSQRIQVKTYSEMAHLLYDVPQNPYVNTIPPLNVDLDDNGVPDGYLNTPGYTDGILDTTDGVASDGSHSYTINRVGSICYINGLAGLEKGPNDFSIWTKGNPGDTITVAFPFSSKTVFKFPATTNSWTNYSLQQSVNGNKTLTVPTTASTTTIRVSCTSYSSGTVKISGMSLRQKLPVPLAIVTCPDTVTTAGKQFVSQIKTASLYPSDTISYGLSASPSWLQINSSGILQGIAPVTMGVSPVTIVATDQHGDSDSLAFNLHIVPMSQSAIQVVSTPDTVVAPNATYYYSLYANGPYLTDSLQYYKLSGPNWLFMSSDGILSGTAPITDSTTSMISVLVKDQHTDADTQSFSLTVHPLVVDNFGYSDSPLNHGWIAALGSGNVSAVFDSTIHAGTMNVSTTSGLQAGVDKYGRWSANTITASIKSNSNFMLSVWIVDSNGTSLYMRYYSGDGQSKINPDNTISFYLGSDINEGSWQSLARNLNIDLRSVKWGATVRRILGFSIRGSIQIGNLVLGNDVNDAGISGGSPAVNSFKLGQNYPNPFNPSTTIQFDLKEESSVRLLVYNILGQKVTELSFGRMRAGSYARLLDMSHYASGVYFYRLVAAGVSGETFLSTRKMMLLK